MGGLLALSCSNEAPSPTSSSTSAETQQPLQCRTSTDCQGNRACDAGICVASAHLGSPVDASAPSTGNIAESEILLRALTVGPSAKIVERAEAAVGTLRAKGVLPDEPSLRADYSSYYPTMRPLTVLGTQVLFVEHEYFESFIGCCVDEGLAVVVDAGDRTQMDAFAQKNRCHVLSLEDSYLPAEVIAAVKKSASATPVKLSCKYRDVEIDTEQSTKSPEAQSGQGSTLSDSGEAEVTEAPVSQSSPSQGAPAAVTGFAVQIAAPPVERDAIALRDSARAQGFGSYIQPVETDSGWRYRVRVGPVGTRDAAIELREQVSQKLGFSGVIVAQP